ncbi:HWE histidine kinase domain-containing protein [Roseomonas sp. E05]|uniref:HWE histidine kinase domain-containing protein n=1 Tax=Roseomonas sp. E05 TaxID=3046310 RepID=UPI0024B9D3D6|nr:HWE histidine kinase domain-containing protein [Roseomonas sp. E05]MDJ0388022.1 HWE histidine kinase domain-containing protein [Roseomonas sp. E05]
MAVLTSSLFSHKRKAIGDRERKRQWPLAAHLTLLCLVLLLPVLLLSGGLGRLYLSTERHALRQEALSRARNIMTLVERDVEGQAAALQVLAASLPVETAGFPRLAALARQAGTVLGGEVTLHQPEGAPAAGAVAPQPPAASRSFAEARRNRAPTISGLLQQAPGGPFSIAITVPVLRDEEVAYLLSLSLDPQRLLTRLHEVSLPRGWAALLVDGQRHIMVHSARQQEIQGRLISEQAQEASSLTANFWSARSSAGEPVLVASALSSALGWRAGVLVPTRIAEAPLRQSLLLLGLGAGVLVALAIGLAVVFARRVARPVQHLARAARQLGQGEPVQPAPASIQEVSAVGAAMAEASTALRQREQALAESESRLARALEAARVGTWEWEVASGRLTGSAGREALYGLPAGALPTHAAMEEVIHPEDRPLLHQAVAEVLDPAGPGHYDVLFRVCWPDGQVRWLHRQGAVVERHPDGTPLRVSGAVMDVTEAQQAAARERQLAREVDHRTRNVLSVVQSVLHMSRADDPPRFIEAVKGRVTALARAHTLLANGQWLGTEFHSLAREAMGPYQAGGRILLQGPALIVAPHAVQPLALLLHELATNAAHHGALSDEQGQVRLSWVRQQESLLLCWREQGGPPTRQPARQGFGLKVVENTARRQLGGTVELRWEADGLDCRLRFETARLLQQGDTATPSLMRPGPVPLRA